MAQIHASSGQQQLALQYAAEQYHVPPAILKGVYAIETGAGTNISTSSAGAVGAFQFLPSTAKSYNYPLTNNVDSSTFTQQAYAAAHYLSDLYHQTGSWDTALRHYSGGGYGLSQVRAKSGASLPNNDLGGPVGAAADAASSVASSAVDVGTAVAGIVGFLTSPTNWLRIFEAIAGMILVAMGLRSLTGVQTSPAAVAATMAKVVK